MFWNIECLYKIYFKINTMFDNINSIEEFYAFSNSDELLQNTVEEYREMLEIKKRLTELSL